jgi:hypothetical protein
MFWTCVLGEGRKGEGAARVGRERDTEVQRCENWVVCRRYWTPVGPRVCTKEAVLGAWGLPLRRSVMDCGIGPRPWIPNLMGSRT